MGFYALYLSHLLKYPLLRAVGITPLTASSGLGITSMYPSALYAPVYALESLLKMVIFLFLGRLAVCIRMTVSQLVRNKVSLR